jgi:glycine/D-amino acid oxidase-like deaminating enzyme
VKVSRLPTDPGPAAWDAILPPAPRYPRVEGTDSADWLIIGAGFAGLAAARRLRQLHPGDRIALLEARRIAEGPVGRNSGFMIDLPHDLVSDNYAGALDRDRAQTKINRDAIRFASDAAAEYGFSPETFVPSGKVNAAATKAGTRHNHAYAAHLESLGEAYRLLDAGDMRALTGSDYYDGGLYTPGTAMLQPALYAREMAAGLAAQGVAIFEGSPVTSLARAGQGWAADTPQGRVTAPKVILAVNGHVESFGHFTNRLMHIYLYASITRPLTPEEARALGGEAVWGLTPADPMGTTVRRIAGPDGPRIVIRNGVRWAPSRAADARSVERSARAHDRAFLRRFPMLRAVTMQHRWGGLLCLSRNGASALGEVEPGLFSACCQNGLGAARGTWNGMCAADAASGLANDPVPADPLPSRLPPAPLAWLGANAMIRWGEFKAGRER